MFQKGAFIIVTKTKINNKYNNIIRVCPQSLSSAETVRYSLLYTVTYKVQLVMYSQSGRVSYIYYVQLCTGVEVKCMKSATDSHECTVTFVVCSQI